MSFPKVTRQSLVRPARALGRGAGRVAVRLLRQISYRVRLALGLPAGDMRYVAAAPGPSRSPLVEVRLRAREPGPGPADLDQDRALAWLRRQTMPELEVVAFDADRRVAWRVGPVGQTSDQAHDQAHDQGTDSARACSWFAAPGGLEELDPRDAAHLESCLLVAAAETVDAVVLQGPISVPAQGLVATGEISITSVCSPPLRRLALYSTSAFGYDATSDRVEPLRQRVLAKLIGGGGTEPCDPEPRSRHRRGAYLSGVPLGPRLEVGITDAATLARRPARLGPEARTPLLVLNSFLARGGAEHTLFETLRVLKDRFEITIVTLAPHRPELGDRRGDFLEITDRICCLGDLVHPAAMLGQVLCLLDSTGAEIIYNANGTTIFYDLAPRLRQARPGLRIVDHLYDHRIGYIDQYLADTGGLMSSVDACVAENNRIAQVLVGECGWPAARVPVVWPCGRSDDAFAIPDQRQAVRDRLRRELGLGADDVVILTAARMHPQKRPVDLVRLASRVTDLERICFLVVGGGVLEAEVDQAIVSAAPARIVRLGFRTDIPDLVVAADAGCLVSDYEGLPVFLLECLQAGPFLGTRVGDLGEVLDATRAGIVVDRPGDLDGLEAAVRRLADDEARLKLARRAETSGPRFSVAACAERYRRVLIGEPLEPERLDPAAPLVETG